MNKLLFTLSTAICLCTINVASAQMAGTGGSNPAMGAEIKHDQATSTTGNTSGSKMEPAPVMKHKGTMHEHEMAMKSMDTNKDGMISKEEFMTFHEAKFDAMKKNKEGLVDMKNMHSMHHHHHHTTK